MRTHEGVTFYIYDEQNKSFEMCVITWKVPDLSSMTWSCWLSSWNPGMPLANSTTSFTAGVKHWEKDSHISWLVRSGPDTGHALRGQALEKDKTYKILIFFKQDNITGVLNLVYFVFLPAL